MAHISVPEKGTGENLWEQESMVQLLSESFLL